VNRFNSCGLNWKGTNPSVSASCEFTKQDDNQYDATSCPETGEIELNAQVDPTPTIRLACNLCDRDDYDGVTLPKALADGWKEIDPAVNIYASSWWTHLGWCPECQELLLDFRALKEAVEENRFE
jgi:hypothetical protein